MSTIEETVSMMETMPEEAQRKILLYARELFSAKRPSNPYRPLSEKQILSDLAHSRKEAADGKSEEAHAAINAMRKQHGFI